MRCPKCNTWMVPVCGFSCNGWVCPNCGGKAGSLRVLTPIANPAAAAEIEEVG